MKSWTIGCRWLIEQGSYTRSPSEAPCNLSIFVTVWLRSLITFVFDTSQWTIDFFIIIISLTVNCKDNSVGNQICVIHSVSSQKCEYLGSVAGFRKMPFNSIWNGVWYGTKRCFHPSETVKYCSTKWNSLWSPEFPCHVPLLQSLTMTFT